jgi:hypothetical protein
VSDDADQRHRREHVALRQADAHVDPADRGGLVEVGLVVHAAKQALHPPNQRALQPADLRLAGEHGVGRLVLADAVVELLGDALEVRGGVVAERAQQGGVVGGQRDVSLELLEARLGRGHRPVGGNAGRHR